MDKSESRILLLYLLKQFNTICEKTGITYYASAGTCLGAIRHKGLIPWDDDIDCMMPRKFYNTFVDACNKYLPAEVVTHSRETDPYCTLEFVKLCFRDDVLGYSDLSLDVFFLDETDVNRKLFRAFQNKAHLYCYYLKTFKVSRLKNNVAKYRPKNPIKYGALKLLSIIPLKWIDKFLDKIMMAEKRECDHYINWGSCHPYKKATYRKGALGKGQKLPFENMYVMAADNPDEILTQLFTKNYMTAPPPEKRVDHGNRPLSNARIDINAIRLDVFGE